MPTNSNPKMILDESQEKALILLRDRLKDLAALARSSSNYEPYQFHELIVSNVIGLLGSRGSGKSTLLIRLYEEWQEKFFLKKRINVEEDLSKLFFVLPLDCSVSPPEIAPGTSVLLRLQESLWQFNDKLKQISNASKLSDWEKHVEKLEQLVGRYTRLDKSYADLCLDLSSSPADYGNYIITGIKERLELSRELNIWLKSMLQSSGLDAFIILLDDFDLIPAEAVRRWLLSLLDELRQPRMIFVITADFHRLEYLSLDEKAQLDDMTGRALVNKLLPSQNRVKLSKWTFESRLNFKSLWKRIFSLIKDNMKNNIFLEKLVPSLEKLVPSLLPSLPRGLVNLHDSYNGAKSIDIKLFLEQLATCRGEALLARRLEDIKLDDWVKLLCFRDEDLSVESWQEMIEAARKRGNRYAVNDQEILPPLGGLVPVATLSDLRSAIYHPRHHENEEYEDTQAARPVSVEVLDSYNRDIALRDPLRHEALRILPLRDAAEEEQPFWAELLINLGLAKSPRNCMSFLDKWKPINIRSENSKFSIDFHKGFLREFFEDNEFLELKPTLYWINQPSDSNKCLEIGWHPLLEALRGQRNPLLPELLDELLISAGGLTGELPHTGAPEALELLPGELWALILLIDALARCPWEDFSSSTLGLKIVTYLGLAAAFVRSAYAFALYSSESFNKKGFSPEQCVFIDALENRDPSHLLQKQEEEILKELANLFSSDDLQQKLSQPKDSLSRATLTYLNSPVYTAVVELVKAQPEVTYSPSTESQSTEAR